MSHKAILKELLSLGDETRASVSRRFFKTAEGEYGFGDVFIGIRVPELRKLVKQYKDTALPDVETLLSSEIHEVRLFALFLLVAQFTRKKPDMKDEIYQLYLRNTQTINNWDLVDSSAYQIVGAFLQGRDKAPLYKLVQSECLWERRISMIATFYFIKQKQFEDALAIAELLLEDKEDLMHKAVGWMLREVGNRDGVAERNFLKLHYKNMPRTMLRYAIEKFPEQERQDYLKGRV